MSEELQEGLAIEMLLMIQIQQLKKHLLKY